ncbi:mycothiol acetyltransferase [Actinoplanes sp. SE50]|uniref:mycothiol synthase n=1 Tax=unclassified Actinoplanes TaxID=2626549 RepID=UPI00023EDF41|nr:MULTISPECIES: mycothiol synthase [unclassified Actinoplanes]AEV88850.1 mycothiol biosynthesis acetyltransferase [Actinoplanes sp. SE50/110]ATO87256.1 mycothiol acetyltransferase [Actinoplanes sp. SE50]SLM04674.1 mycothiol synthase [Actinoplanes sp. SE50/110]
MQRLPAAEIDAVLALTEAAGYPLSEDVELRLRNGGGDHLLAHAADGSLAGYAFLEDGAGELVVHPAHRRQGHGSRLLDAAGPGELRFWAHGDDPAARAFAERRGFLRDRVLWQMRRSLLEPLPDIPLPAGVTVRGFRPGSDEQAWLEVNARAFAHHPEQGRWTLDDLLLREGEPWFDPAGFLLAVDVTDRLLGFHWTKVHTDTDPPLGEIYVLGVDPAGHRRGLGAALSVAGLKHLAGRGLEVSNLYVDESNTAAVRLYRYLGFEVHHADINYRRPA